MNKYLPQKENCCGCEACAQICPVKCIQWCIDEEGFFYPETVEGQCIDCGRCGAVCPVMGLHEKR